MPSFKIKMSDRDYAYLKRTFANARALGYASRLDDDDAGALFVGDALLQGAAAIYQNQRSKTR